MSGAVPQCRCCDCFIAPAFVFISIVRWTRFRITEEVAKDGGVGGYFQRGVTAEILDVILGAGSPDKWERRKPVQCTAVFKLMHL